MRVAALFAILSAASVAFAQKAPQLKETINVHLVEVPVSVVDRGGHPVRGLKAEDFTVLDDGKAQKITHFDVVDLASRQNVIATSPLNPAARRNFLLLFDLTFSSPLGRQKAQAAAAAFIARGMSRGDRAAVATIDVDRGFHLATAFTSDHTLLAAAVASPLAYRSSDPLQISGHDTLAFDDQGLGAVDQAAGGSKNVIPDNIKDIAIFQKKSNDAYNRSRVEHEMMMLGGLARTLHTVSGRKTVVFFSEGFDARLVQGRDPRATEDMKDDMEETTTGNLWRVDFDQQFGSSASLTMLERMARFFRGSDVVLNAVDIQGLRVQNDLQAGKSINSNEGLYLVARATGGEVFKNSNDISADLDKMLAQQDVVYVLGFSAPSRKAGAFHDLKVRVKGQPFGTHVVSRAGYYENGAQNAMERVLTNAEIITNDIPQDDVHLAALAVPFPKQDGNAQVPVILEINGDDLLAAAKANKVVAQVFVYAFDDEGLVRDRLYERLTLDTSKVGTELRRRGVKYYGTLSLPPGHYAIKSLVRIAETDRKGFARNDVVVPSADDVAVLQPFFIEPAGQWLMVKGASHDAKATYPFQINGEPFIPSAVPQVRNGVPQQFALFVYNSTAEEMTMSANVSEAGAVHQADAKLLKELQGGNVTKMLFQYAPGGLGPGHATFDLLVRKKGSSDERKATSPLFVVQ